MQQHLFGISSDWSRMRERARHPLMCTSFLLRLLLDQQTSKSRRASALLSSSRSSPGDMRWCVVATSKLSTCESRHPPCRRSSRSSSLSLSRYVRFLIKYHLLIFFCTLMMTSAGLSFLIYRRDRIDYSDFLRVGQLRRTPHCTTVCSSRRLGLSSVRNSAIG